MKRQTTENLRTLCLDDPRPWLVGFSGGKDSTLDRMRRFSQQHQLSIFAVDIGSPKNFTWVSDGELRRKIIV